MHPEASYVHLHVHTEYSMLDSCARIDSLVEAALSNGFTAMAITDHDAMHGAVSFYTACKKAGIRPVIGLELSLRSAPANTRTTPRMVQLSDAYQSPAHITLLAGNATGYQNLLRLATLAHSDAAGIVGVDRTELAHHAGGLFALSGCSRGEVARALARRDEPAALRLAAEYREWFGADRYSIEIQRHGAPDEEGRTDGLVRVAKKLSLPVVATQNAHYVYPGERSIRDALLAIGSGQKLSDPHRLKTLGDGCHFASQAEMVRRFGDLPDALVRSGEIASQCQVDLLLGDVLLPDFDVPGGESPEAYLERLCQDGLQRRYASAGPEVYDRLHYELGVIKRMGYAPYMLVVWDVVRFATEHGIPVGPGRGSAASSLVAYTLGITEIDPLRFGLIFERFLNPDRLSLPDIDIDFAPDGRSEVIRYVARRYGSDRVAQIATFGTLAARAAVRDVGRVLDVAPSVIDRVAKMIPSEPNVTLSGAVANVPELERLATESKQVADLMAIAQGLEGLPRHLSTHAAGVVISPVPLVHRTPLMVGSEGWITQYAMGELEQIGLVKIDFLGLRILSVIQETVQAVNHRTGSKIDLNDLPLDDPRVYAVLSRGETIGLFQLETPMFRALLKEMRPTHFRDLVAVLALGRPGPMDQRQEYMRRRQGKEPVRVAHPILQPILAETYGVLVYQEQVMRIATEVAGYSPAEADHLRRAMAKKRRHEMDAERNRFVNGAVANGVPSETALQLFEEIARFAEYAFNASHSAAYALVTYQTAYLKVYYPAEFMAAQLNSVVDSTGRLEGYLHEYHRLKLRLFPVDINQSGVRFAAEGENIRPGLISVRHVGTALASAIVEERLKGGPYRSVQDMMQRHAPASLSRNALISLVQAGALNGLGASRAALIEEIEAEWGMLWEGRSRTGHSGNRERAADLFGATSMQPADASSETGGGSLPVTLTVKVQSDRANVLRRLEAVAKLLKGHPGETPVMIRIVEETRTTVVQAGRAFWVRPTEELLALLAVAATGEDAYHK